jgi:methyl-accepting chemotaxis protein
MGELGLRTKLGIGFGTLLLIVMLLGALGYRSALTTESISRDVQLNSTIKELSFAVRLAIEKEKVGNRDALLNGDTTYLNAAKTEFQARMEALSPLLSSEEGRRLFADVERANATYCALGTEAVALHRSGKSKDAVNRFYRPDIQLARTNLNKGSSDLVDLYESLKAKAVDRQSASDSSTKSELMILICLGLLLGVATSFLIARSVVTGLSGMLALIQEIAANNLAAEDIRITSRDETGKAGDALNRMKHNLHGIIQSIAGTADHLVNASEEISSSATQQAQSAETQKDQAVQVATAMQEMSTTVNTVSDSCNKAADAAREAAETARAGGSIVDATLAKMRLIAGAVGASATKMEELGKSSDQIGRIISVIDDIADQTNLLALNAAIEAARAGEQGRGFAVVADEVRKLAERTTTATKEIAQMIKNIQDETKVAVSAMESGTQQVEEGVTSTAKAGDSLRAIIQMSEQVGGMITEIATAAAQQSSTTEQVNGNVEQISKLVKESAIGAQQSAAACQDLSSLALDLQTMVSKFKLQDGLRMGAGNMRDADSDDTPTTNLKAFAAGVH